MNQITRWQQFLLGWILLLSTCAHVPSRPDHSERPGESGGSGIAEAGVLVAQGWSPGMSCFGHVVILPSGEVAQAATAAAAKSLVPPAPQVTEIIKQVPTEITPRQALRDLARDHAVFFGDNLDYRQDDEAERLLDHG